MSEKKSKKSKHGSSSEDEQDGLESVKRWRIRPDEVQIDYNKKLGEGKYGVVYKGFVKQTEVAVKKLTSKLTRKDLLALLREVDFMSQNLHPNILLFMKICTDPENLLIITEYMPNGSVKDYIESHPNMSLFDRIKMAQGVARGMNWLHSNNIIHRDLKPQNLLVDSHLEAKVCDMGLSIKLQDANAEDAAGSPLYMAPECLLGMPYDQACDVYSFALIVQFMLTGQRVYGHIQKMDHLVEEVCYKKYRPPIPSTVAKQSVPPALVDLLNKCWANEPSTRPSFDRIVRALNEVLVDCAIDDPEGSQFWKDNFIKLVRDASSNAQVSTLKMSVKWTSFNIKLSNHLKVSPKADGFTFLRELIRKDPNSSVESLRVDLGEYGRLCKWFGPHEEIVDNVNRVFELSMFHPTVQAEETKLLLKEHGDYLIRFSMQQPGAFTLSCFQNGKGIVNFRICYNANSCKFVFDEDEYDSLDAFIEKVKGSLQLGRKVNRVSGGNPNNYLSVI